MRIPSRRCLHSSLQSVSSVTVLSLSYATNILKYLLLLPQRDMVLLMMLDERIPPHHGRTIRLVTG